MNVAMNDAGDGPSNKSKDDPKDESRKLKMNLKI